MKNKDYVIAKKKHGNPVSYFHSKGVMVMTKTNGSMRKHAEYHPQLDWKAFVFLVIAAVVFFAFRCFAISSAGISVMGSKLLLIVGIAFLLVGILDALVEARMDLPFFYGKSQSGGFNSNSYFMCAVGIACLADDILRFIAYTVAVGVILAGERFTVEEMRCKKKEKYIGLRGMAETDIDYKGKGSFGDQIIKVRVTDKAIKRGAPIVITDVEGFHLVVRTQRDSADGKPQGEKINKKWAV